MGRPDDATSLRQMRDHATEALAFASGRSRMDLDAERLLALGLVKLLEILGEAASRVSPAFRERRPQIPWQRIIDLRNRLIHGYDSIDLDIVWSVLTVDLPPLAAQLERVIEEERHR